jgi:hypothetical protein
MFWVWPRIIAAGVCNSIQQNLFHRWHHSNSKFSIWPNLSHSRSTTAVLNLCKFRTRWGVVEYRCWVHVPTANLRIYYSKRATVYLHVVTVWFKHNEIAWFWEVRGKAGVFVKLPTNLRRTERGIFCIFMTPVSTFVILAKFRALRTNLPL